LIVNGPLAAGRGQAARYPQTTKMTANVEKLMAHVKTQLRKSYLVIGTA
jgi:hypothetical protein